MKPVVRFAPSPTGFLHLGGLRTSLFNYLHARHTNGKFILRIEDTDATRSVPGTVDRLLETLKWAGVQYDEGPDRPAAGLTAADYIQSTRFDIYRKHAEYLVERGLAYKCYCPKRKDPYQFGPHQCVQSSCERPVIRFMGSNGDGQIYDRVYGQIPYSSIPNTVLLRSDGTPTYHLASVVDDHLMDVTLIFRGQEWLPSTPLHMALYRAFGWQPPETAHLPILCNPDKSKLSKRQDAVRVEHFRKEGFLPEALVNFVAFLGWTPSVYYNGKEILTMDGLVAAFRVEDINRADPVVDIDRIKWFNRQHMNLSTNQRLVGMLDEGYRSEYGERVIGLLKTRVWSVKEIPKVASYFYSDPNVPICEWTLTDISFLTAFSEWIVTFNGIFDHGSINAVMTRIKTGYSKEASKAAMLALRLVITGVQVGASMSETMAVLGKETCHRRLSKYLCKLNKA